MRRICEICGRVEELENEQHSYEILDVCSECTDHLISSTIDQESDQKNE